MKRNWLFLGALIILVLGVTACSSIKEIENNNTLNDENTQQENTTGESGDNNANNDNLNDDIEESNNNNEIIKNEDEDPTITALVNKQYSLDENYIPEDLVTVDVPTVLENPEVKQLRRVAADALKDMFEKAKEADVFLHARSGYRSYLTQVQLYQNYTTKHGEEAANRYSAKPGQSEHQTGLVMDVTSESVNYLLSEEFGKTVEGKWLSEHAHEFGFIIRYPKDREDITGYIYEPWHIRFLGVDMAKKVYESGLTYEEYVEEEGTLDEVTS